MKAATVRAPEQTPTLSPVLRRCACGGSRSAGGECSACAARRLRREAAGPGPALAPPLVHDVLRGRGSPLAGSLQAEMGQRLGHDFSHVRVHTDAPAAASARAVDAHAYAVGSHVVFGAGTYAPATTRGKELLAHELTHTVQQSDVAFAPGAPLEIGAPDDPAERAADTGATHADAHARPALRREPIFPDATCAGVQGNITRAWPTARSWVQNANRRIQNPRSVGAELGRHFHLDPNDPAQAADLQHAQQTFARMAQLFDSDIPQFCVAPNQDQSCIDEGVPYYAYSHSGDVAFGIHHCRTEADRGLIMGEQLVDTIVHEMAHIADAASRDFGYHEAPGYATLTHEIAVRNGDSYSEFARDLYEGGSFGTSALRLTLGTGALLGGVRPLWALSGGFDIRSRTGLEFFDLIGGLRATLGVGHDSAAIGVGIGSQTLGISADFGVLTRSRSTSLFLDARLGVFVNVGGADPTTAGLSPRLIAGWAARGFRVGAEVQPLIDFLHGNNAVIIGVEIGVGP